MTEVSARRAATRDRLCDAAMKVIGEKGVLGASVEEICEAAGFTRGAFYSNFESKDELCGAIMARQLSAMLATLEQVLDRTPVADDEGGLDGVLARAIGMFLTVQPADRHWVLAAQELRLHAAREPAFAPVYRQHQAIAVASIADAVEGAVRARGCELTTTGPQAVGVLHAVHDYGAVGALIGTDAFGADVQTALLAEVVRALVRPRADEVSSPSGP